MKDFLRIVHFVEMKKSSFIDLKQGYASVIKSIILGVEKLTVIKRLAII